MELKFKRDDILKIIDQPRLLKVLATGDAYSGFLKNMYKVEDVNTGRAMVRNKDVVEGGCRLATPAEQVLYGNETRKR